MIPHNKPSIGRKEIEKATAVLESKWLSQGSQVKEFEEEFCKIVGVTDGGSVALSSGTAALFVSLHILGVVGEKVAIPAYSCRALPYALAMARGKVCLVDNGESSVNLDMEAALLTESRVIVATHTYGIPMIFQNHNNKILIEDCCQALGASVGGKTVGNKGKCSIFSFGATKMITTGGQGGIVASSDLSFIEEIRDYREFDKRRDDKHRFNFQMTDIQAAIGVAQLRRLPEFTERRAVVFEKYRQFGIPLLDTPSGTSEPVIPVRYRAIMKTSQPQRVIEALAQEQISSIIPFEESELLGDSAKFPNALNLCETTVSLPIYPEILDADVDKIVRVIAQNEETF